MVSCSASSSLDSAGFTHSRSHCSLIFTVTVSRLA